MNFAIREAVEHTIELSLIVTLLLSCEVTDTSSTATHDVLVRQTAHVHVLQWLMDFLYFNPTESCYETSVTKSLKKADASVADNPNAKMHRLHELCVKWTRDEWLIFCIRHNQIMYCVLLSVLFCSFFLVNVMLGVKENKRPTEHGGHHWTLASWVHSGGIVHGYISITRYDFHESLYADHWVRREHILFFINVIWYQFHSVWD